MALGVSTTQTDKSLMRRTSSVTSSDDGAVGHGYYARLTPVAYMGFFKKPRRGDVAGQPMGRVGLP